MPLGVDKLYFHSFRLHWPTYCLLLIQLSESEALNTVINTQEQHYKTEGGREGGIQNVYFCVRFIIFQYFPKMV